MIFHHIFARVERSCNWSNFLGERIYVAGGITSSSIICGYGDYGHLLPGRLSKPSSLYLQLFFAGAPFFISRAGGAVHVRRQKGKKIENKLRSVGLCHMKRRFLSDSFSVRRRQYKQHDGQVPPQVGAERKERVARRGLWSVAGVELFTKSYTDGMHKVLKVNCFKSPSTYKRIKSEPIFGIRMPGPLCPWRWFIQLRWFRRAL